MYVIYENGIPQYLDSHVDESDERDYEKYTGELTYQKLLHQLVL